METLRLVYRLEATGPEAVRLAVVAYLERLAADYKAEAEEARRPKKEVALAEACHALARDAAAFWAAVELHPPPANDRAEPSGAASPAPAPQAV